MTIVDFLSFNNLLTIILTASFVSWIIFGIIIGIIIHYIDPGEVRGGVVGTIITAIIGAVLGGLLSSLIFGINLTGLTGQTFLIALAGAIILSIIERVAFRNREHIKTKITRIH